VIIFVWIVMGILLGLLASTLGRMDATGWLLNSAIGIVGAILGGWLFSWLSETWTAPNLSVSGLFASLLSAAALLAVARLARVTG
jgi:uncharacterized membrane protein YeaQ/YmgE (transglycosylase-associated protein family)